MTQEKSPAFILDMRVFATAAIVSLIACAHCRTLDQGNIGYVVPGGKFSGTPKTYTECGSISTYSYLLDDHMLAKVLERAEKDRGNSSAERAAGFLWSVKINPVGPSCYTLSVYGEN